MVSRRKNSLSHARNQTPNQQSIAWLLSWLLHVYSTVLSDGLQGGSQNTCTMQRTGHQTHSSNATRLILLLMYSKEYFWNQNVNDLCECFQLYLPSRTAQVYGRVSSSRHSCTEPGHAD